MLSKQYHLFVIALGFLTRLPIPKNTIFKQEYLNQAARYFPLVGMIIGILNAIVFITCAQFFSVQISVLLSIIFGLMLTGAFHEDGLADMADGFGGGFDLQSKLTIMKDSRLGTYGTSTLILALLAKFIFLTEIFSDFESFNIFSLETFLIFIVAHSVSRSLAVSFIFDMNYAEAPLQKEVSDEKQSKTKPLANKMSFFELVTALFFGLTPLVLLFFNNLLFLLIVCILLITIRLMFKHFLNNHLKGYNGDALGGGQQIFELSLYLIVLL